MDFSTSKSNAKRNTYISISDVGRILDKLNMKPEDTIGQIVMSSHSDGHYKFVVTFKEGIAGNKSSWFNVHKNSKKATVPSWGLKIPFVVNGAPCLKVCNRIKHVRHEVDYVERSITIIVDHSSFFPVEFEAVNSHNTAGKERLREQLKKRLAQLNEVVQKFNQDESQKVVLTVADGARVDALVEETKVVTSTL